MSSNYYTYSNGILRFGKESYYVVWTRPYYLIGWHEQKWSLIESIDGLEFV